MLPLTANAGWLATIDWGTRANIADLSRSSKRKSRSCLGG